MTSDQRVRRFQSPETYNRVRAILLHVSWYGIAGQARLARDCGVCRSTISRVVHNRLSPSYSLARAITDALGRRLGVPLDIREVFSTDGSYPTARVCDLAGNCRGCFPPEAFDEDGAVLPDYRNLSPGDWCTFRTSAPSTTPAARPAARPAAAPAGGPSGKPESPNEPLTANP